MLCAGATLPTTTAFARMRGPSTCQALLRGWEAPAPLWHREGHVPFAMLYFYSLSSDSQEMHSLSIDSSLFLFLFSIPFVFKKKYLFGLIYLSGFYFCI